MGRHDRAGHSKRATRAQGVHEEVRVDGVERVVGDPDVGARQTNDAAEAMGTAVGGAGVGFAPQEQQEPIGARAAIADHVLGVHELNTLIVEVAAAMHGTRLDEYGTGHLAERARRIEGLTHDTEMAEVGIAFTRVGPRARVIHLDKSAPARARMSARALRGRRSSRAGAPAR